MTADYSRNLADHDAKLRALVTAIANVYHNGDVDAAWAAILAFRDAREAKENASSEPPPKEALLHLRFRQ